MGSRLSSLLVQEGFLRVEALKEVLALQVIKGGQLDTILLEKGLLSEATVVALLSRVTEFPPLSPEMIATAEGAAGALDALTAERLGVCPVGSEGQTLSLLVGESVDHVALEELAFELGRRVSPFIAPEVRVLQARQRVFGTPVPARFATLLQRLGDAPPLAEARSLAPVRPIEPRRSSRTSQPEISAPDQPALAGAGAAPPAGEPGFALLQPLTTTSAAAPAEPAPSHGEASWRPLPAEPTPAEPAPPAAEPDQQEKITEEYVPLLRDQLARPPNSDEVPPIPLPELHGEMLLDQTLDSAPPEMPPIPPDAEEATAEEAELLLADSELIIEAPPPLPAEVEQPWRSPVPRFDELQSAGRGLSRIVSGEITIDDAPSASPVPPQPPAESPALGLTEAIAAMQSATHRDPLLFALARGAHSCLECVQIYVPKQGALVGHFEVAAGHVDQQHIRRRRIALDVPSVVSRAMNDGGIYLGPIPTADSSATVMLSAGILSGEGIALVPVQIKGRAVCLLVGHDYDRPMSPRVRAPLGRLAEEAAAGLVRIIVQQKQQQPAPAPRPTRKRPSAPVAKVEVSWESEVPRAEARAPAAASVAPREAPRTPGVGASAPPALSPITLDVEEPTSPGLPSAQRHPETPTRRAPTGPFQPAATRPPTGPTRPLAAPAARPPTGPFQPASLPRAEVAPRPGMPRAGFQFDTVRPVTHLPALDARPEPSSATLPALIDELEAGGASAEWAGAQLRSFGAAAIAALITRFPGKLRADRFARGTLPPASQCSSVLKALASFGRPVIFALAPLFHSRDVETRFYVTYLLSELVYPEAVALLATRLQDKDAEVRRIAALTLGKFREMDQFPGVLLDLRADLQNPDPRPRRAAIEALAALGDTETVPPLIKLLADPDQVVVETAVNALVTLTKQDLARNEKRWQAWWERNSHRHRMEWLIDGLVHKAPDIRSAAIAELEQLTGLTFGYSFDMPRREREGIRRRFVDWWAEVGIEQFR